MLGVSRETRDAVTSYAAVRGITVGEVLEQELRGLVGRMETVFRVRRELAAVEAGVDKELKRIGKASA